MQQNMKILIIALSLLALSIPVQAADVTYEIRSTIYDASGPVDVGSHYWDANTFPGFWYQIGGSRSSEVIYIHNTWSPTNKMKIGDTIPEGQMYYASKPVVKRTKIGGLDDSKEFIVDGVDLENYYLAGFFGAQNVVMSADNKNSSSGCNPEELAKILIESDDKKTMTTGEEWKLPGGWSLVVQQIDIKGNKVWLELKKEGEVLESEVLSTDPELPKQKRTYLYKDNNDNPVFYCYVASTFKGTDNDIVVFECVFLRDEIVKLEAGKNYGAFEVKGFTVPDALDNVTYVGNKVFKTGDSAIIMANEKSIELRAKQSYDLHGGISLRIEDSKDLKFSLRKKCTIKVEDCKNCSSTPQEKPVVKEEKVLATVPDTVVTKPTNEVVPPAVVPKADAPAVENVAKAPGFGFVLALSGLFIASRIKR